MAWLSVEWVALFSSMIANTITTFLTFPLDTIKTRQQSAGYCAASGLGYTRGLFNGIGPTLLVSVPCCGLYFTVYETLQRQNTTQSLAGDLACALGAQILSGALMIPGDVLKVNLQTGQYSSPGAALQAMLQRGSYSSCMSMFQRRLFLSYLRDFTFACIQMTLYTNLQRHAGPLSPFAGAIAAGTASIATTPIDTLRTRLLLADALNKVPETASQSNYFAGVVPRVLLAALSGFIFFRSYEAAKPLVHSVVYPPKGLAVE
eukprot:EG_transcript_17118